MIINDLENSLNRCFYVNEFYFGRIKPCINETASCMVENYYRQNTKQGRKFLHFPQVCNKHAKNYKPNNILLHLLYDLL